MKVIAVNNLKLPDGYHLPGTEITVTQAEGEVLLETGRVTKPGRPQKKRAIIQEPPPAVGDETIEEPK